MTVPRAAVSRSNEGGENRNYTLWIDVPSFRIQQIKQVHCHFCEGFVDRLRISHEPTSSFAIGYLGWGNCPIVNIDIILHDGQTIKKEFSFEEFFKTNPLVD